MIRLDSFARSAGFAAVVALGWIPWWLVWAPLVGGGAACTVYLVAVTALYTGGLATSAPRRASVTIVGAIAATALACIAPGAPELCVGLAVVLGTVRSAFLYRANPNRAVTIEAGLLIGGLLFARFLAGWSIPGVALALWGFLLVQSCFFLIGGTSMRAADPGRGDPFEAAVARAKDVLERPIARPRSQPVSDRF